VIGRDEEIPPRDADSGEAHQKQSRADREPGGAKPRLWKASRNALFPVTFRTFVKTKRLVALGSSALVAGAKFRGEFEDV